MTDTLTIRRASAADALAVERLATLDSASPPTGDLLLAEMGDELWAALSASDGTAVADPFRPSGELVELLRFSAKRAGGERRPERRTRIRLLPRAA